MVETPATRRIFYRALLAVLAGSVILAQILPLDLDAGALRAPDTLILLLFAWALRRPDYVPTLLTAAILLAADILCMRPLGLWSAIGVLGVDVLRRRGAQAGELPFLAEWTLVAAMLAAMTLAEVAILGLLFVPQPALGAQTLQFATSALAYPLVVLVSTALFGVRAATPAERDILAGRA